MLSLAQAQAERVLENTMPEAVPICVRIKKEKEASFKDMKNDRWVRELEIEVTNTGTKPIYFLFLTLRTNVSPGIGVLIEDVNPRRNGLLGLDIQYGRPELGDIISKSGSDDIPIKPGETWVLAIHPGEVKGWELAIRDGAHPQPTKLQLIFQAISFGDGTGLFGAGAHLYPPPKRP